MTREQGAPDNDGSIWRIPIDGGPRNSIGRGGQAHWGSGGDIVFAGVEGLFKVGSQGGTPELIFTADTARFLGYPHLLPGGDAVVFGTQGLATLSRIAVLDIASGEVSELAPSGVNPQYLPTGTLVYAHPSGALMGVPVDLETLRTTGPEVTLLATLGVMGTAAQYDVSRSGTLIYSASTAGAGAVGGPLVSVGVDGEERPIAGGTGSTALFPRFSPGGGSLAYMDPQLRILDLGTGAAPQFAPGSVFHPTWSADGEYLYYLDNELGAPSIRPADGRENATSLWSSAPSIIMDVSPDDSILVVSSIGPGSFDIMLARERPGGFEFEDFLATDWAESNADVSPDGQWVAYQVDEEGEPRIYVTSFPVASGRHSVSPGRGTDPVFAPDGRALYYRDGARFYRVSVTTEPVFAPSAPQLLFDRPEYASNPSPGEIYRNWDLHPDGFSFVMVRSERGAGSPLALADVYVVTDWFEELRQRMGSGSP